MAGNTGKMTRDALEDREPRMALARLENDTYKIFDSEEDVPYGAAIIARSFTRSYLKRIEKYYNAQTI